MNRLIERTTPHLADRFVLEHIEKVNGHDVYEIEADGNHIILRASSDSALAAGYYRYLRDFCDMDLSPCGNTEVYASGEPRTPKKKIVQVIPYDLRLAMDYDIYAHDAYAWDWDRWERELDFLAMQGVNAAYMPVGQEAVWYYAALDMEIKREDAMVFLSNPCYYPLQLSGKLDSYFPMTDTNYLKAQIALGLQIVTRMREVGIEPILPAFSGHVPKYLKGYFPQSSLYFVTPYGNFPFTYRVYPDDPLFAAVATALQKRQTGYFGTAKYYMADPFLGVKPRVKESALAAETGKVILSSIRNASPDAIWVLHACDSTQELTQNVPKDAVLVLDTDGTNREACGDLPYIRGMRINLGAHTVLCGDAAKLLQTSFPDDAAGVGVFSAYSLSNPLYAACAYRRLSEDASDDAQNTFVREALRRWGSTEDCLHDAAQLLMQSCYNADSPAVPVGSIPAARPSTQLCHTAPGDTLELHYDNRVLCRALEKMLSSEGDYTDGYVFDVCDLTRQMLSNYARRLYVGVIEGYQKRDGRLFESATNGFLRVLSDMDLLLSTRPEFNLNRHLYTAGNRAEGKNDQQNFELAFLASLTLFGPMQDPQNYDIRWKEWSDLTGDYYAQRWHAFFTLLAENFKKRKQLSTVCRDAKDGRNPQRGNKFCKQLDKIERKWITSCTPKAPSEAETLTVAQELLTKYKPLIESETL